MGRRSIKIFIYIVLSKILPIVIPVALNTIVIITANDRDKFKKIEKCYEYHADIMFQNCKFSSGNK